MPLREATPSPQHKVDSGGGTPRESTAIVEQGGELVEAPLSLDIAKQFLATREGHRGHRIGGTRSKEPGSCICPPRLRSDLRPSPLHSMVLRPNSAALSPRLSLFN